MQGVNPDACEAHLLASEDVVSGGSGGPTGSVYGGRRRRQLAAAQQVRVYGGWRRRQLSPLLRWGLRKSSVTCLTGPRSPWGRRRRPRSPVAQEKQSPPSVGSWPSHKGRCRSVLRGARSPYPLFRPPRRPLPVPPCRLSPPPRATISLGMQSPAAVPRPARPIVAALCRLVALLRREGRCVPSRPPRRPLPVPP